jgi:hypothetical protein
MIIGKTAMNENVTISVDQNKDIFDRLQKNIDQVYQVTQEIAGLIELYLDLKHDDKEVEDTQRFWELLGRINQLAHDVRHRFSEKWIGIFHWIVFSPPSPATKRTTRGIPCG